MNIISWNCQGLGVALTIHNLKEECLRNKPQLVFLMETKQKRRKVRKARRKCGFDEEWIVDPVGRSGGLALWWMEDVVVNILFSSKNIIHTCISSSSVDTPAYVTFIYGPPDEHERNLCWQEVRRIARSINDSWLCVGDYNDILFQDEKLGGNPRAMRKLLNFQCFVADCELMDLGFNGYRFTWRNNREGDDLIEERLDRALGNINLREKFPQLQVFNIEPIGSDHHMLLVNCCYNKKRGAKLFRFETLWTAHPDYCAVVRRSWREETDNFSKMEQFLICLSNCRKTLSQWSKKEFPNNRKKIASLKDQLTSMRLSCRTGESLREMMDLKVEIEKFIDRKSVV